MGTRADFYVGKGKDAEWIGSIAWDGYRDGIPEKILKAKTEKAFRKAVEAFFSDRNDVTLPAQGWPWPWDDSGTTDCSYWFFSGRCWDALGYPHEYWYPCDKPAPDEEQQDRHKGYERAEFPDMSTRKSVTFGPRSGMIVVAG